MAVMDPGAPVLVGVGEASGKSLKLDWPSTVDLASAAVKAALDDSGAANRLAHVARCRAAAGRKPLAENACTSATDAPTQIAEAKE